MVITGLVDIYEKAVADFGWSVDKELVKKLKDRNAEDEKKINEKYVSPEPLLSICMAVAAGKSWVVGVTQTLILRCTLCW